MRGRPQRDDPSAPGSLAGIFKVKHCTIKLSFYKMADGKDKAPDNVRIGNLLDTNVAQVAYGLKFNFFFLLTSSGNVANVLRVQLISCYIICYFLKT